MISLKEYREFWEMVVDRVDGLKAAMPVSIDDETGKRLQSLSLSDTPALFFLPPSVKVEGNDVDTCRDVNECVALVIERFDPQREASWDALERLQNVILQIKRAIINASITCDALMDIDLSSLAVVPETELWRGVVGWSIGFKAY